MESKALKQRSAWCEFRVLSGWQLGSAPDKATSRVTRGCCTPKLVLEHSTGQGVAHQDRWDGQSARILLNESLDRINTALAAARRPVVTALEENVIHGSAATKVLAERTKLFQEIVMASPKPDGRIDPGGATEIALLAGLPAGFTENRLRLISPEAQVAKVEAYTAPLNASMDEYDIDTPLRQAHFIAQVAVESDRLRTALEYASGEEQVTAVRMQFPPGKERTWRQAQPAVALSVGGGSRARAESSPPTRLDLRR